MFKRPRVRKPLTLPSFFRKLCRRNPRTVTGLPPKNRRVLGKVEDRKRRF